MKVLLVNKFYYPRGGSESALFLTARVLERHGHRVAVFSMAHPSNFRSPYEKYFVSGVDFDESRSPAQKLKAAGRILYSFEARRKLDSLIREFQPDVAHLHNIHHQLSPSVLHTLRARRIPVVMTLHDYKLVCPTYRMLLNGQPCERCRRGRYYQCFLQRCSKRSRAKSFLSSLEMYLHHDILGTQRLVDVYLSPSRFLKDKVAEMGFKENVILLFNGLDLDGLRPAATPGQKRLVYFGRLAPEKGLHTLLSALKDTKVPCLIIGEGPLRPELERRARRESLTHVSFCGYLPPMDLKREVGRSRGVVVPSVWYENNPYNVLEAFGLGRPVIASRVGGLPELVRDGRTGWTFTPGNAEELRSRMESLVEDPARALEMGRNARRQVERQNGTGVYYRGLMAAYRLARERRG
jgi:glycosyltransferase involved in cell wall biosynthesis